METFTWKLELKLDGVNWTDCSADVPLSAGAIEVADGFNSTSLVDLLANPGSIKWTFDNSAANSARLAGYYTPGHANCRSGFAKNIQVRYSETYNSIQTYHGPYWLKKITPTPGIFGAAITTCQASDWLDLMTEVPFPILEAQTSKRADQLLTTLLAAIVTQPAGTDFDTGDSTFAIAFDVDDVTKDTVYSGLSKIARSEYGRIFLQPGTGGGGILTFEKRNADAAKISPLGSIANTMDDVEIMDNAGEVYDRVEVQITDRKGQTASWDGAAVEANLVIPEMYLYRPLEPGEEFEEIIPYLRQSSVENVAALNVAAPLIDYEYWFGTAPTIGLDDLRGNLEITTINKGARFCTLKVKNIGGVKGYMNGFGFHGQIVLVYGAKVFSSGAGGKRVLALEMPYVEDLVFAQALADALQPIASDNTRRSCKVRFHANKSAELMAAAQAGLISTRWTITETQTALESDFFVAGRRWSVGPGNRLDMEWLCRPVMYGDYLLNEDSTYLLTEDDLKITLEDIIL